MKRPEPRPMRTIEGPGGDRRVVITRTESGLYRLAQETRTEAGWTALPNSDSFFESADDAERNARLRHDDWLNRR